MRLYVTDSPHSPSLAFAVVQEGHVRGEVVMMMCCVCCDVMRAGFQYVDPIGAIMVSGMIMKTGVEIGWEAVHHLVDAQVNERVLDEVKAIGKELSEEGHIKNVHNVRCRRLGHYVLVDLHVMVDEYLTVTAAHEAAQRVERIIKYRLPEVAEVMIHLDAELDHRSSTPANEEGHPDKGAAAEDSTTGTNTESGSHSIVKDDARSSHSDDEPPAKGSEGKHLSSESSPPSPKAGASIPATAATPAANNTESSPRRTQQEIEADILQVFTSLQEKQTVLSSLAHVSLHYLRPSSSSSSSSFSSSSSTSSPREDTDQRNHHHSSYVLAEVRTN
mmetsp:Transcript_6188/g.8612  ORF Transcript_6188/g.8612 Transcript_6188/m.8612 type:complete len:331 (+) Transcript_6188:782-1774(+)